MFLFFSFLEDQLFKLRGLQFLNGFSGVSKVGPLNRKAVSTSEEGVRSKHINPFYSLFLIYLG